MWLVDTATQTLKRFVDDRSVQYAILSHLWSDAEVLFDDVQHRKPRDDTAGWRKLDATCNRARQDGYAYVWVDTCCIDKTSSSELSEAINSMYRWYQNAEICYAFLEDVQQEDEILSSGWFKRGWTLQELIAPKRLKFYTSQWSELGKRETYATGIFSLTGIPISLLKGIGSPAEYSIALRMSWAATRQTTRAEDIAYSLMGLFNVNMPMLYGEGAEGAFIRLQEEIIKDSNDQTIFAWRLRDTKSYSGLLARSPAAFAGCQRIEQVYGVEDVAFQKTNVGLQISLRARQHTLGIFHVELLAKESDYPVGIFLGCPDVAAPITRFGRRMYRGIDRERFREPVDPADVVQKQFTIPTRPFPGRDPGDNNLTLVIKNFSILGPKGTELDIGQGIAILTGRDSWDPYKNAIKLSSLSRGSAVGFGLSKMRGAQLYLFLKLGFSAELAPWAWIFPPRSKDSSVVSVANRDLAKKGLRNLIEEACKREDVRIHKDIEPPLFRFIDLSAPSINTTVVDEDTFLSADIPNRNSKGSFFQGDRINGLNILERGLSVRMWRDMRIWEDPQLHAAWRVDVHYNWVSNSARSERSDNTN